MKYDCKEIKIKLWKWGLYLGTIWWNLEGSKNYRWHKRFSLGRLVKSGGVSFWDKKYW